MKLAIIQRDLTLSAILLSLLIVPTASWAEPQDTPSEFEQIVVTATLTESQLRDVPASITVITREELLQRPVENIMQAVRESTGITLSSRGVGGRGVINLRGMDSHQTLVLLDGKRTTTTDNIIGHSNFQYNQIPIEAIERIEIIRGPLSALYGSEALGGVINIITRAVPKKWGLSMQVRAGTPSDDIGGEEASIGLFAAGPVGKYAGLTLSGSYFDRNETELKEDPKLSELEGIELAEYLARLTVTPWKDHRFELEVAQVNEERSHNTIDKTPPYYTSTYDLDRSHYSIGYDGTFDNALLHIGYYQSSFDQINTRTNGKTPTDPQELEDRVFDSHISFPLLDRQLITLGGEYRTESLRHPALTGGEDEITHKALFIQDEVELLDDLILTAGLRGDDHETYGLEYSPRLYLVYHHTDQLTVKGGYGHGFKAPTIKQVSPDYVFNGPFTFVGNPNLSPETSDNYELAILWEEQPYQLGITFFHNDIDDLIQLQCIAACTLPFGRTYHYENIDDAFTQGIETEIALGLTEVFSFNLNHTYMKTENRTTGLRLPERPEHSANARLNMSLSQSAVNAAIRMEYIGSQVQYGKLGNEIGIPDYVLWHFNISKQFAGKYTVLAGIDNIGNVRLEEKSDALDMAERGRFYYVGFDTRF
ncbi:MAG: TonB-dependent receptor [Pseudomonadales bacterium]|nr:TonB-dependent receptor [Pseudomonadales bacterium]